MLREDMSDTDLLELGYFPGLVDVRKLLKTKTTKTP